MVQTTNQNMSWENGLFLMDRVNDNQWLADGFGTGALEFLENIHGFWAYFGTSHGDVGINQKKHR